MRHPNWECLKCKNKDFETAELSVTGGPFSKFFNIQNQKYTTVICSQCSYTEMYKEQSSTIGNILDFFGN